MLNKITAILLAIIVLSALSVAAGENEPASVVDGQDDASMRTPRAVFAVTNNFDSGPGSLRDAINQANANPGFDQIVFNISPAGPHSITPLSQLPPLVDPNGVFIDGISQPGGADCGPNPPSSATLLIEINGAAAGAAHGLWVGSDVNQIVGLIINDFEQDGICVEGGVFNPSASNNMIHCCFIGTDPSGAFDVGNGRNMATLYGGVRIKNVPGGTANNNIVDGCLVSGNYADGVTIWGPQVPGDVGFNIVALCYIGTDVTGTVDLGNDHEGVSLVEGTHDNLVADNLISGNDYDGVGIQGFNNVGFGPPIQTFANFIEHNIIGLDINLNPLPNSMYGVTVGTYGTTPWGCADNNTIGPGNIIAHNGFDGVYVWEDGVNTFNADHNRITQNSIYDNGGLGIDLHFNGVTPNDPADPDVGANEEMNFPVINSAVNSGGTTTIMGTLDFPAPGACTIEIFKARRDPTGHGEGEVFLGSTTPATGGAWSFTTAALSVGDSVTATAYDGILNTSEFSLCVLVSSTGVLCGDVDVDGGHNVVDLTYMVDYLFKGGPAPLPSTCCGDYDGSGPPLLDVADLSYCVDYLFRGGPPPVPGCCTPMW